MNSQPRPLIAQTLLMGSAAFLCYLSMFAFRKPFAAASYSDDITWLGLELKTAFVLAQLFGYILSKFVGIWWLSARVESGRFGLLMRLMFVAYAALIAFYLLPTELKPLAMLVNGMPLGMIWGVVISYLEGRRQSDTLLVMLASSFVIATSLTKDVGLWVMNSFAVDPYLMPVVVATLFYPLLAASGYALEKSPAPTDDDTASRSKRSALSPSESAQFFKQYWPGLVALIGAFMLLTAFRDFRDNFGIEIISNLGYDRESGIFTALDFPVAVVCLISLLGIQWIRNHKHSLYVLFGVMSLGAVILIVSTMLMQSGHLSGLNWLIAGGIGSYLGYIGYSTIMWERLIANLQFSGTAVFAIYVSDSAGYTGSFLLQIVKDLFAADVSRLDFFVAMNYGFGAAVLAGFIYGLIFFTSQSRAS